MSNVVVAPIDELTHVVVHVVHQRILQVTERNGHKRRSTLSIAGLEKNTEHGYQRGKREHV